MTVNRRTVWAVPLWLATRAVLRANAAKGDPRLEKLYPMFIAPCCWRENLLVHQSPKADELRADIRRLVDEGKPDEEIKALFIEKYSTRILALPEGAKGEWLQWTPRVLAVAGLGAVAWAIRRSLARHRQEPQAASVGKLPELPESEWS